MVSKSTNGLAGELIALGHEIAAEHGEGAQAICDKAAEIVAAAAEPAVKRFRLAEATFHLDGKIYPVTDLKLPSLDEMPPQASAGLDDAALKAALFAALRVDEPQLTMPQFEDDAEADPEFFGKGKDIFGAAIAAYLASAPAAPFGTVNIVHTQDTSGYLPAVTPLRVKPLEWKPNPVGSGMSMQLAITAFETYVVAHENGRWYWSKTDRFKRKEPDEASAKAAAQADDILRVHACLAGGEASTIRYRNHRGEVAERRIVPLSVWYGATEWHPEPQLLLRAFDADKQAERDFAIADILAPEGATPAPSAFADVLAERIRQIEVEGWTPEHDDKHDCGQMTSAAGCYAMFTSAFPAGDPPGYWPWPSDWWKPTTRRRNLVKAGALILAEIERLDRAAAKGAEVDRDE